ncbi:MAG: GDSL-type esterase/lipase family protein, partial [Planctomycetes bacterium]|nr:GDSL-type esterase/lipase family protein [Planctomycetota bacterium]
MRRLLPPATLLCLIVGMTRLSAQEDASSPRFVPGSVKLEGHSYPYQLLTPGPLEEGKQYPLVLFLHGAGERGNDNKAQKRHFPERVRTWMTEGGAPAFVLAPQCPRGAWWSSARPLRDFRAQPENAIAHLNRPATPQLRAAMRALEEVVQQYPIDRDRIALTGLSMGGYGSWELATRRPGWFSGVLPICGGGTPRTMALLAGIPIQVWHGDADTVVQPESSRRLVRALQERGISVDYRELPGVGHNSWQAAYGHDDARRQLFEAQRNPSARVQAASDQLARVVDPNERIAFLGDSITQAGHKEGGYVDLVRNALKKRHADLQVIPAGISGHKVPDLLARYEKDVITLGATVVFIYIGINDVWHSTHDQGTPVDIFESGLHQLVDGLQAAGAEVVLATPSVIGEKTPGNNSLDSMLDQYAEISRKVAAKQGL